MFVYIPFSGRNLNLIRRISLVKPIILLLNKCDLIDPNQYSVIEQKLLKDMEENNVNIKHIFFINSLFGGAKSNGFNQKVI